MAISIQRASWEDSKALAKCYVEALKDDGLQRFLYKGENGPAMIEYRKSQIDQNIGKSYVHMFKAIDEATGEIVGFSGWKEPNDGGPPTLNSLPESVDLETIQVAVAKVNDIKKRALGDRQDVIRVTHMAVLPSHQRRGIGRQLLQPGFTLADKGGRDIFLESTPAAKQLYLRNGFEVLLEEQLFEEDCWLIAMLREAHIES